MPFDINSVKDTLKEALRQRVKKRYPEIWSQVQSEKAKQRNAGLGLGEDYVNMPQPNWQTPLGQRRLSMASPSFVANAIQQAKEDEPSFAKRAALDATGIPFGLASIPEQLVKDPIGTLGNIGKGMAHEGLGMFHQLNPGSPQAAQYQQEIGKRFVDSPVSTTLDMGGRLAGAAGNVAMISQLGRLSPALRTVGRGAVAAEKVVPQAARASAAPVELGALGIPQAVRDLVGTGLDLRTRWQNLVDNGWNKVFKPSMWKDPEYRSLIVGRDLGKEAQWADISKIAEDVKGYIGGPGASKEDVFRYLHPSALGEPSVKLSPFMVEKLKPMRAKLAELELKAIQEGILNPTDTRALSGDYLRLFYTKHEGSGPLAAMFHGFRRNKITGVKARKLETAEERIAAGLIVDPVYSFAKGEAMLSHNIHTAQFFRKISENPEWVSPAWQKGFSKSPIPNNKSYGALAGKYVPKGIYDDVTDIIRMGERGNMVRFYEKMLGAWKMGKTAYNPSTHARNMFSNMILADLADVGISPFNPASYDFVFRKTLGDYVKKGKWYQEAKSTGLLGSDWMGHEVGSFMRHVDDANAGNLSRIWDKMMDSKMGKAAMSPAKMYQAEEHLFKMAVYRKARERGMLPAQAAARAEEFLFNYGDVPNWIQWLKRSPVGAPFVTFTYKAVPLVVKTAIKSPFKVGKYALLAKGMHEMSKRMLGLTEEESALIDRNTGSWEILLPIPGENGAPRTLDATYNVPWGDIAEASWFTKSFPQDIQDNPVTGFATGVAGHFFGSNPISKLPLEVLFNKNMYTGQEIYNPQADQMVEYGGEGGKKIAKYAWEQATPPLTPGNYNFESILRSFQNKPVTSRGRVEKPSTTVARSIFGLKIRERDLGELRRNEEGKLAVRLYGIRKAIRDTAKDQRLSEGERQAIIDNYMKQIDDVINEWQSGQ